MIVQEILSRITARSPMVGTPVDQVQRLINQGLIKDLILPLLSVDRPRPGGGGPETHSETAANV